MFPANHQRYLFSRFRHIDEILGDAIHALELTDETRLFPRAVRDATAAQRKILEDYLAQLRFALKRFIDTQQLQDITRPVSGLWSLRTAIIFAQTAATELRPMYMQGYGPLPPEAAEASDRLVAELNTLLKRMGDYLDKGEQGDLAARLAHLEGTPEEIALLRELERIITHHGLVELRSTLESLTDRALAPRYEVAVFGRVNSGKSSLLNWCLGQELLPTGVTPITAVPTRIGRGAALAARIKIAGTPWREIPTAELAAFVTEELNSGNKKRVLELVLEVPSPRLSEGVYLIDTPGLGSFAGAGAAQTLEYLPRCDLGVQLIEAGGVISREDLAIARALLDGGSDLLFVLSKADRLAPTDLQASIDYATDLVRRELGTALPVHPISTVGAQAQLAQAWFDQELGSRLSGYREESRRLLRRKIGALRETVIAVITARTNKTQKSTSQAGEVPAAPVHERLARVRADLEKTRADFLTRAARVRECGEWLVEGACEVLVNAWVNKNPDLDSFRLQVGEAIARRAAEIADVVSEGLRERRESLQRDLTELFPNEAPDLPVLRGRPPYDTEGLPALESYERPLWGFARPLLNAAAKQRIDSAMLPGLTERLSVYGEALKLWGTRYLDAFSRQLDEVSASSEAWERSRNSVTVSPQSLSELERDLELLQGWPGALTSATSSA